MKFTPKPRGKNQDIVKTVSGVPSQGSFVRLKFPCISMHILGPNDEDKDTDYDHYCLTWSDYDGMGGQNPGKFKLQRIVYRKPTKYMANLKDRYGNKVKDILWHRQNDHLAKVERCEQWEKPPEAQTVAAAKTFLIKRFGKEFAEQAILAMVAHPLFQDACTMERQAA